MVNFPTSFGVGCFQRTWCTIWYSILFPSEFYLIFHIWYFRVIFHSFSPYTDGRKWNDHERCCIFWHQLISWFRSSGAKVWVSFIRNCSLFFSVLVFMFRAVIIFRYFPIIIKFTRVLNTWILISRGSPPGVLKKNCTENMRQIYRRTPMPKCDFNKVIKRLYWNRTRQGHFPVNLGHIFRAVFLKNTFKDLSFFWCDYIAWCWMCHTFQTLYLANDITTHISI